VRALEARRPDRSGALKRLQDDSGRITTPFAPLDGMSGARDSRRTRSCSEVF
jgi:hypothetical protein